MARLKIEAKLSDSDERVVELRGHLAHTLLALAEAGSQGITPKPGQLDFLQLTTCCSRLRKAYGLDIIREATRSADGWCARFVLQSPVEILVVEGDAWAA